jgi:hypothetical protein
LLEDLSEKIWEAWDSTEITDSFEDFDSDAEHNRILEKIEEAAAQIVDL